MAIQPIDLQTLFTQVDKVGKSQAALKEGLAVQQAIEGTQLQQKTDADIKAVNKTQDTGEGVDKVSDREGQKKEQAGGGKNNQEDSGEETAENARAVIRDPRLGKNIDISL